MKRSYYSAGITEYNYLGAKRLNPERPGKPKQEPISKKKADFHLIETSYEFHKNDFIGKNASEKFVIVVSNCGFPIESIGHLSDISGDGFATFTDEATGKQSKIDVLSGMALKDFLKIQDKFSKGLIKFSFNKTYGNRKLSIVEKVFN